MKLIIRFAFQITILVVAAKALTKFFFVPASFSYGVGYLGFSFLCGFFLLPLMDWAFMSEPKLVTNEQFQELKGLVKKHPDIFTEEVVKRVEQIKKEEDNG